MATVPFYEALSNDILKWSVNDTQLNPDRGAMKDAYQVGMALQGMNYESQAGLLDKQSQLAQREMASQADLARRNQLDTMTAEHQFQMEGMDRALDNSLRYQAQEGATMRDLQQLQNQAQLGTAAMQLRGVESQSDASRYAASTDRDARIGTAMYELQGVQTNAAASRDVGMAQADASRYGADRDAASREKTAEYGYRGAIETAKEQGTAARDVASIQGQYGADANRYSQDAETTRAREGYASTERQIGLSGTENRRTVETQGEQSRRTIATEGEQARMNIRTTSDEQRRSLAYERANAARTAIAMSRRG